MNDFHEITTLRLIASILQAVAIITIGVSLTWAGFEWTSKPKGGWNILAKIGAGLIWFLLLASYAYVVFCADAYFPDLTEMDSTSIYKV